MKNKGIKGITLIALVITIIVLLILAGITIAELSGSGLFENGKEAKIASEKAKDDEEIKLDDYSNQIDMKSRETSMYTEQELGGNTQIVEVSTENIVYNTEYVNDQSENTWVKIYRSGKIVFLTYSVDLKKSIPYSDTLLFSGVPKPLELLSGYDATEVGRNNQVYHIRMVFNKNSEVKVNWSELRSTSWSSDDGCRIEGHYTYFTSE